ncbi:MAG: glycosyltransferase, partial [Calditrichota bacterium]
ATIALEAMACETPAVISKVGGNIGMIEEGKGGFYCEPADVKDLAGKILSLLQNGHVSELGRTGRNYVKERFSWEQVVRTYMVLLDKET